ncbi:hypothetical protein ACO0LM_27310 [Undibacterium sp. Di26W]|uniref:hypothetical protein n=1 Tax=Undibacterium sp. Di26W TaxID=3413035 RepID=UPI003BF055E3
MTWAYIFGLLGISTTVRVVHPTKVFADPSQKLVGAPRASLYGKASAWQFVADGP